MLLTYREEPHGDGVDDSQSVDPGLPPLMNGLPVLGSGLVVEEDDVDLLGQLGHGGEDEGERRDDHHRHRRERTYPGLQRCLRIFCQVPKVASHPADGSLAEVLLLHPLQVLLLLLRLTGDLLEGKKNVENRNTTFP